MNAVVKSVQAKLPAVFRNVDTSELTGELAGGVTAGFPVISYRGKVWRVKKGGKEQDFLNDEGDAMPAIEIVIVRSNKLPSKTFYEKRFEEGMTESPRCWSADGTKPDAGVQDPISKLCASCPKNAWGSKITDNGSKGRACADVRRMAVVMSHELETKGKEAQLLLLRVPPASLNPLKDYAEKMLGPKGIPFYAVVTKVGFDNAVSHPKLTFKATRFLTDEEAEAIVAMRDGEDARHILAEAAEFDEAGTTVSDEERGKVPPPAEPETAPAASAPKKTKPKMRPVEEEEVEGEEIEAPAPAPAPKKKAAAPAPVVTEEAEEEIPAPAPKKAAKKAAAAPVEVTEEGEEIEAPAPAPAPKKKAAAPAPAAEGDFDAMLDSILG